MASTDASESQQEQSGINTFCAQARQLSVGVADAWHFYHHLSLEYLRIPLPVRNCSLRADDEHLDTEQASPDYPTKDIEWRCEQAFDFEFFSHDVDERVELVEGRELGGPGIMWTGFAVQRAYHASIFVKLKTDPQSALEDIKKASGELVELQNTLKSLEEDINVLQEAWRDWEGPPLVNENGGRKVMSDGRDVEPVRRKLIVWWTEGVGHFTSSKLRFKGEDVQPHEGNPGDSALGVEGPDSPSDVCGYPLSQGPARGIAR